MTGTIHTISALLIDADALVADAQSPGAITPARFRQHLEDILVTIQAFTAQVPTAIKTANYVLALNDAGTMVEMNVASANTVTIPPNSSVAFPINTIVQICQYGPGVTTVIAPGVTLDVPSTTSPVTLRAQFSSLIVRKHATDEWIINGDIL